MNENEDDEYPPFEVFIKEKYEWVDVIKSESIEILNNIKKINDDYLEEIDRLRVLVNKASMHLPLIERIKFRAASRGIILMNFTLDTIPQEASDFYSYDELSYEIMKNFRHEQEKLN